MSEERMKEINRRLTELGHEIKSADKNIETIAIRRQAIFTQINDWNREADSLMEHCAKLSVARQTKIRERARLFGELKTLSKIPPKDKQVVVPC